MRPYPTPYFPNKLSEAEHEKVGGKWVPTPGEKGGSGPVKPAVGKVVDKFQDQVGKGFASVVTLEKPQTYTHFTDTTPKISTKKDRLIPNSISLQAGKGQAGFFGKKKFHITIKSGSKILSITREDWDKMSGAGLSNMDLGQAVERIARMGNYDAIRISGKIHGLGDEIAVLNPGVVARTERREVVRDRQGFPVEKKTLVKWP